MKNLKFVSIHYNAITDVKLFGMHDFLIFGPGKLEFPLENITIGAVFAPYAGICKKNKFLEYPAPSPFLSGKIIFEKKKHFL